MSVSRREAVSSSAERDGVGGEGEESIETAHPAPLPPTAAAEGKWALQKLN